MVEFEHQEQIITRAQAGDDDAFKTLVHHYLPAIFRYANKMLSNNAEASEISQEVFVRFWEQKKRYDPDKAKLGTWLHQIAHNLCVDHFRYQSRFDDNVDGPEVESPLLEQEASNNELGVLLKVELARLPERQRNALVLCHYQGISNRDAAHIMNVSVEALESLLSRARRTLRQALHHEH